MITTFHAFKESLQHDKYLYRTTSEQWLINFLTNGSITTNNKNWISLSQDIFCGGIGEYDDCIITFNETMIYNQGAIEIDYEDPNFWLSYPSITKHVTGCFNEQEYYYNIGFKDAEDANNNNELTFEEYCESYKDEEEVVINKITYQTGLILNVQCKQLSKKLSKELINLLNKFKIKYETSLIETKQQPENPKLATDILTVNQDTLEPVDMDEWCIDQVIDVFTDTEKIKKIEENSNNINIDLSLQNIKINDKIYVSCLLKPRNNSTAYPMGQYGVVAARVTDIFYGLNKINQLSKSGKLLK